MDDDEMAALMKELAKHRSDIKIFTRAELASLQRAGNVRFSRETRLEVQEAAFRFFSLEPDRTDHAPRLKGLRKMKQAVETISISIPLDCLTVDAFASLFDKFHGAGEFEIYSISSMLLATS